MDRGGGQAGGEGTKGAEGGLEAGAWDYLGISSPDSRLHLVMIHSFPGVTRQLRQHAS